MLTDNRYEMLISPITGVNLIMIKRHTRIEQQQHIDAWQHSRLTKQHYCEQQGITLSNFYYWLKNVNNNTDAAPASSPFIPARCISVDANHAEAVTLNLPNGCSVCCLPAQLRSVMQALSLC
ncbi:IS66 family insertion sequence element accessory protein TnpA [Dickeya dianthicola]|uniref:IS66 family insertion sequence element accessory protein TnpA n=1 Tax=Dickeya dianthicola TaxID=204039 RepID=UPI001D007CEC|nr:hypothetical protein [Dickeya dianthicola]